MIGLSFYIFKDNKLIFICSEVFIVLSLVISAQLYKEVIAPLRLLITGVDAIREKDFNVKFLNTGTYEMDQLIEVYNQMIDQLRLERTRQEQQHHFLEKLVQTSPTGILILDFDENIAKLNPKVLEMLKAPEGDFIGKSIHTLDHPAFQIISSLKTGESRTFLLHGNQTYKCQKSHFVDRGFPHYFVMIEELTVEILSAEKKAYSKVIRMMAHEVNNSIGAVNSILDTTVELQEHREDIREALKIAIQRNDHLNHFMRNFADVVRLPEVRREKIEINELLGNVVKLMQFKASRQDIQFRFDLSEMPVFILADPNQIEQVLINIIKNAIESLELNPVSEEKIILFSTSARLKQICIEDNGPGIPAEIEEQLFSPFFTSKKNGQGIGLTLIREILIKHGFTYSLKTIAEKRTVFRINF
ncbi:HAMP domain-containing protein [Pseudarcicella hirudinis]|uniref:histidine kinase n=1 Tax=Pseudarcicella hirudinis TaxID=1079859 RepID=A0A1I5TXU5_9BACT|nr:ATP-binding protein [Pseudarcicella hirudinis]SFP87875.1 HAMP domain-containing protein [Pseudarcicella hirudinis]